MGVLRDPECKSSSCVEGKLSISWNEFPQLDERGQAEFLLRVAKLAVGAFVGFPLIECKVQEYLALASELYEGRVELTPALMVFIEDPEMRRDFGAYFEVVKDDEAACAALDLASYACAFLLRIVCGQRSGRGLPDSVLEALPEIHAYYRDRAAFLGI
ncbi:hypothetical protein DBR42_13990 [Pelomonas sp. HMWF004]|nr:hypothetical protein DBR42_13990 [Pelomonas sp. HMWF004]